MFGSLATRRDHPRSVASAVLEEMDKDHSPLAIFPLRSERASVGERMSTREPFTGYSGGEIASVKLRLKEFSRAEVLTDLIPINGSEMEPIVPINEGWVIPRWVPF